MKIKRVSDAVVRSFKMRLCHVSDTHGNFPKLYGRYDVVIHTGDLFPNSHHCFQSNKSREMAFQLGWLRSNLDEFKRWVNNHTLLYVPGNHDFLHPDMMEYELQSAGIKAYSISDRLLTHEGVNFYGFPYIPAIDGTWNYERQLPEMQQEVDKMVAQLNTNYVDVLACHAPPYRTLDLSISNEILGSTAIADALDYKIKKEMMPATYLCGHIHEAYGVTCRNGMLISNAATTINLIEV